MRWASFHLKRHFCQPGSTVLLELAQPRLLLPLRPPGVTAWEEVPNL